MDRNNFNSRETAIDEQDISGATSCTLEQSEALTQLDTNTLPLIINVFKNEKDNKPERRDLTWGELRNKFYKPHVIRKEKAGGMAMSPVSYKPGTQRGNQNVESVFCAVFDIEHQGPFEAVREKLSGYAFLAHSSYRHTVEDPRYRIVLPLVSPVPAEQWPLCWAKLNHWLGGINDAATKDAARLYYLPSKPVGAADHFIVSGTGKPLDIDELSDLPPEQQKRVSTAAARNYPKVKIDGIEEFPPDPLSPAEGLKRVVAGCAFMAKASDPAHQQNASRAIWMGMVSNACRFEDSEKWIHDASRHHNGYDEKVTDKLIESCRNFPGGPITCATIQEAGYSGCPSGGCKTVAGNVTKAPAGLWMQKTLSSSPAPSSRSPATHSTPDDVGEYLASNYGSGLVYTNGAFLGYVEGWWQRLDDLADVKNSIARHYGKDATPLKINELFALLQAFLAVAEAVFVPDRRMICLANGTLNTDTFTLEPHSQAHGLVNRLNLEWDPGASCPRWLQFLDEIFVNDADKVQKITFLKEWFGYCLIPDSSQHKFVWMVGAGGNGKSVLLAILTALVGAGNVSHAYLERLDKAYVRAELEAKLVNISSEMSAEATISDGYFKAIVSGDILEAERKFKPPFSFRPYVRLIGATNHLPRLLDLSEGFFRRAIVLMFNRQFVGDEIDPTLESTLMTELPGILTWAMQGLHQLRQRGTFDVPQSSIAALGQYRQDSDPVAIFAEECLERVETGGLRASHIYEVYSRWCPENGFSRKNITGFGKRLAELGFVSFRTATGNCWRVDVKEKDDDCFADRARIVDPPTTVPETRTSNFLQQYRV